MRPIFNGSVIVASTLLVGSLIASATPSEAETLLSQIQKQATQVVSAQQQEMKGPSAADANDEGPALTTAAGLAKPDAIAPPGSPQAAYVATAYCLRGRTASGK